MAFLGFVGTFLERYNFPWFWKVNKIGNTICGGFFILFFYSAKDSSIYIYGIKSKYWTPKFVGILNTYK